MPNHCQKLVDCPFGRRTTHPDFPEVICKFSLQMLHAITVSWQKSDRQANRRRLTPPIVASYVCNSPASPAAPMPPQRRCPARAALENALFDGRQSHFPNATRYALRPRRQTTPPATPSNLKNANTAWPLLATDSFQTDNFAFSATTLLARNRAKEPKCPRTQQQTQQPRKARL